MTIASQLRIALLSALILSEGAYAQWEHQLTAPGDGAYEADSRFGASASYAAEFIAVGRPNFGRCGAVEIIHRVNGIWEFVDQIIPDDCTETGSFGHSVSMSDFGGQIRLAASDVEREQVYLFQYNRGSASWSQTARTSAVVADSAFGSEVHLDRNWLAVGAGSQETRWFSLEGASGVERTGQIYAYTISSAGTLSPGSPTLPVPTIRQPTMLGNGARFVLTHVDDLPTIVSLFAVRGSTTRSGVWKVQFDGGRWVQRAFQSDFESATGEEIGPGRFSSVAYDGSRLYLGQPSASQCGVETILPRAAGCVSVLRFVSGSYQVVQTLHGREANQGFGDRVALGSSLYVTAWSGQLFVGSRPFGSIIVQPLLTTLVPLGDDLVFTSVPESDDFLGGVGQITDTRDVSRRPQRTIYPGEGAAAGTGVALTEGMALLGAPSDDQELGSVFVFRPGSDGVWANRSREKLVSPNRSVDERFGIDVAIDGAFALVGAPGANGSGMYRFELEFGEWRNPIHIGRPTNPDISAPEGWGVDVSIDGGLLAMTNPTGGGFAVYTEIDVYSERVAHIDDIEVSDRWLAILAGDPTDSTSTLSLYPITEEPLVVSDPQEIELSDFRPTLAMDGDVVAVSGNAGVSVYHREGETWSLRATIPGDRGFGDSLAISGDRIIVGNGGQVQTYDWIVRTGSYEEIFPSSSPDGRDSNIAGLAQLGTWSLAGMPRADGDLESGSPQDGRGALERRGYSDGVRCDLSEDCGSGFCVDGFCCNVACDQECDLCGFGGSEGVCIRDTSSPECLAVEDAGVPDAGGDAGMDGGVPDAGVDASTPPDSGTDSGTDSGIDIDVDGDEDGCACRTMDSSQSSKRWFGVFALGLLFLNRRRARR